ncbi:MAG: hypothetical protein IPP33_10275 [Flavobacteriales bacterium]|nr:hypothetical protein [Flavobacteriales bacterium]
MKLRRTCCSPSLWCFCHLVLHAKVETYTVLFDLDLEANLPTFFNCALYFLGAALMFVYGRNGKSVRGCYLLGGVRFWGG